MDILWTLYGHFANIYYRDGPWTKGKISVYSIKGWEGGLRVSEDVLEDVGS